MGPKRHDIAAQIEQEHACLRREMNRIREEISKPLGGEDFTDWRLEFMWRLRDFRNDLLKHFDLEEEGGFMTDVLIEKPEAITEVRKLEKEHDHILSELDDILIELKVMVVESPVKLVDVNKRTTALLDLITAHESSENELIQAIYYREYGYPAAG